MINGNREAIESRAVADTLRYEIVDVFTDRPFAGNPLAVVLDGDDLTATQMQALAREFNLSETAFPLASAQATYRLRIFTPETELPFAGHPSIGAAHTLARLGRIPTGDVTQECGAGLLPVRVDHDEVTLTGGDPVVGSPRDAAPLLEAVGLSAEDLAPDAAPPRLAGCGISFAYLQVRPEALAEVAPNPRMFGSLGAESGVSVFAWDPGRNDAHARVFAGEVGVAEDPATGSAALGLGVWLVASGLADADATTAYTVRQGIEIHRPSTLRCAVSASGGRAVSATVAGGVVPVAAGEIAVP